MSVVIVHGAGSTCAAAAELLGIDSAGDTLNLEDRSGDTDILVERLHDAVGLAGPDTTVVGVSLGAHAIALWAAERARRGAPVLGQLVCALPAWMGPPGLAEGPAMPPLSASSAAATALAGERIAADGIAATLSRLQADPASADVLRLLQMSWSEYSDDVLATCLATASTGQAPDPDALRAIREPVAVLAWEHDPLHPASVAREWSRHLRRSTIAVASRPQISLMRECRATVLGAQSPGWIHPRLAVASGAPHPRASPHPLG